MSGEPKRIVVGVLLTLVFVLTGFVPVPPCAPAVCGASCEAATPPSHACCGEAGTPTGPFGMSAATRACICGLDAPLPAASVRPADVRLPLPATLVATFAIEIEKEAAVEPRSLLTERSPHRRGRPVFLEIASLLI
ncbi:MAG: hypothetical protein JNK60_05145 [Acidobacteria bacterium]|nr:hypothetical protein [Acidobacteriota bacterium]